MNKETIPEDIQRKVAEVLGRPGERMGVDQYMGLSLRVGLALAAERERCAKIADGMFDKLYGEPGLQDSVERALLMRIANAMRGHQP